MSKVCNFCKISKNFTEFYPDKRNSDGRTGRCRLCCDADKKASRIRNRPRKKIELRSKQVENIESKFAMSDSDAAYCAGIVDSEGTIGVYKKKPFGVRKSTYHQLLVSVTMTNSGAVNQLAFLTQTKKSKQKNKIVKNGMLYGWHIYGLKAFVFLRRILPFLKVKKKQAEFAISFYQECYFYRCNSLVTNDDLSRRDQFENTIKELKLANNFKSSTDLPNVDWSVPQDSAYLAGIVDGEGCIGIYGTKRYYNSVVYHNLVVTVQMREFEAIKHLFQLTKQNGGKLYFNRLANTFVWSLHGIKAADFLKRIVSQMTVKKEQAELAIKFYRYCKFSNGNKLPSSFELYKRNFFEKRLKEMKSAKEEIAIKI